MRLKIIMILTLMISCEESKRKFFKEKTFVGNVKVSAKTLELGRTTYMEYCVQCHGAKGDGNGLSAKGLVPPPRDFTQGLYKFVSTITGELPHDEDLMKTIKMGLNGTAMLPWDIGEKRLYAVTQYIKTFAPEKFEVKGDLPNKVKLIEDPFTAQKQFAIERGKQVYHFGAMCQSCHRGYVDLEEYNTLAVKSGESKVENLDEDFYLLKLQESEYQVGAIPPDFTWHSVRSASTVKELAYRLASGIGGSAMPSWKDTLDDSDIWAVAYYVRSLMDLREDFSKRKEFMMKLGKK